MSRLSSNFGITISSTLSALAQEALSMNTGEWRTFVMGGLSDLTFIHSGFGSPSSLFDAESPSNPSICTFTSRGQWDSVRKKIHFAGTSHTGGTILAGAGALVTYDDATNRWSRETYSNWGAGGPFPGHANHHVAVNSVDGTLYFRGNGTETGRKLVGTTGDASWNLTAVPAWPRNNSSGTAGACTWYPQANGGAGGLVMVESFRVHISNAAVTAWNTFVTPVGLGSISQWAAVSGGYHYCGRDAIMLRVDANGAMTQFSTPLNAGNYNGFASVIHAHPNGIGLLSFQTTTTGSVHYFNGSTWTLIDTNEHPVINESWGVTIPDYNVLAFFYHPGSTGTPSCKLYKPGIA